MSKADLDHEWMEDQHGRKVTRAAAEALEKDIMSAAQKADAMDIDCGRFLDLCEDAFDVRTVSAATPFETQLSKAYAALNSLNRKVFKAQEALFKAQTALENQQA
jgi:hypothetical protein